MIVIFPVADFQSRAHIYFLPLHQRIPQNKPRERENEKALFSCLFCTLSLILLSLSHHPQPLASSFSMTSSQCQKRARVKRKQKRARNHENFQFDSNRAFLL